jgi:hypothetical protein
MSTNGKNDQYSDAPTFVVNDKSETGKEQYGNTVFAADAAETGVAAGISHQGWVKRTAGTGGRSGRVQYETLSTARISGDATDFANTDASANSTGTADDTILADS